MSKTDPPSTHLTLEEATQSMAVDYFSRKVLLGMISGKIVLQNLSPDNTISSTSVIHAHESPVVSLDWAHPTVADMFVSCEEAGTVRVWLRKSAAEGYMTIFETQLPQGIRLSIYL